MTDRPKHQLVVPAGAARTEFGSEWRRLVTRTRRSQSDVARQLNISDSQMSRYAKGENLPKDVTLSALCELIDDVTTNDLQRLLILLRQARAESSTTPTRKPDEPTKKPDETPPVDPAPLPPAGTRPARRKIAVGLGVVVAVATATLLLWPGLLWRSGATAGGTPNQSGPSAASSAPASRTCDRFTIAAADLFLRDEHGEPQTQIEHGRKVTVKSRSNPAGLAYWQVAVDDGREGWVDPHWLRPACG
ncbi:helix-turn-helix domain-containing protein [Streptosporangiaceae bacterium NEAU-GS5]|nr:helix-turn-helix domain-containing protein [Streptosporangiaceae bacterium NEAU-GS5]